MTPAAESIPTTRRPWTLVAWFALLLAVCYAPVFKALFVSWDDPDMGHGYFVPLIAALIVWQQRAELLAIKPQPNWWGLAVVLWGGLQLVVGTLGVETFTVATALVISLIGMVWLLGGNLMLKKLGFPLFLLFFMVRIPSVIYSSITFPLQILASKLAEGALMVLGIPVMREGNILELPSQQLSVVEACSGIRSLLTLTFLALVYGHFFEKKIWIRITLFLATVPIAIVANGSRVTVTGIISQVKPELAEGFFHESTGWVIFMVALFILIAFHQVLVRVAGYAARKAA